MKVGNVKDRPTMVFDPDITVPDLSFSVKEIMANFGHGMLDLNVLKAQQRDESALALGIYDLTDYSKAMKESKNLVEKALADKKRIEETLLSMQRSPDHQTAPASPSSPVSPTE